MVQFMQNGSGYSIPFPVPNETVHQIHQPTEYELKQDHGPTVPFGTAYRQELPKGIPVHDTSRMGSPVVGMVEVNTSHLPPTKNPTELNATQFDSMPDVLPFPQPPATKVASVAAVPAQVIGQQIAPSTPSHFISAFTTAAAVAKPKPAVTRINAYFNMQDNQTGDVTAFVKQYDDVIVDNPDLAAEDIIVVIDNTGDGYLPPADYHKYTIALHFENSPVAYMVVPLPGAFKYDGRSYGQFMILQRANIA